MSMRTQSAGPIDDVTFLIIDDDQISVMAVQRAIRKLGLPYRTCVARDGIEALNILKGEEGLAAVKPPYIVLLDINMPRMNGHEFLYEVREDSRLRNSLIFILSTSDTNEDVENAFTQNVAAYLLKGDMFDDILSKVKFVDNYVKNSLMPL